MKDIVILECVRSALEKGNQHILLSPDGNLTIWDDSKSATWFEKEKCEAYDIEGVKTWGLKLMCSRCGFIHTFIEGHMSYAYCPSCGSFMESDDPACGPDYCEIGGDEE